MLSRKPSRLFSGSNFHHTDVEECERLNFFAKTSDYILPFYKIAEPRLDVKKTTIVARLSIDT